MNYNKKRLIKKATALTLGVGIVSSSLVAPFYSSPSKVMAIATSYAESILANLTPEQRQVLNQLSSTDQTGLFLDSSVNVNSENPVKVIVSFKNKPEKVAILEAALHGKSLSADQAKNNADADHATFKKDLAALSSYNIIREYKHAFNGVALEVPANKLNEIIKSEAVLAIYSDATMQAEPIVPEAEQTQGKGMADERSFLKVDQLHQEGYTGKGVKVAILDTGIDYNHPDLKDAYKGGHDFVQNDNDPMETTYADWIKAGKPGNVANYVTAHGTHVAGTIAGQGKNQNEYATTGIAPDAEIYSYRVLGPGGSGTDVNIIAAIDQAVADGMDVMNLSLGANINDPMYPTSIAINNAVLSGVTAVIAAGNAGNKMYTLGSPGSASLALTVGASNVPITTVSGKGSIGNVSAELRLMARGYSDNITMLKGQTNTVVDGGLGDNYTGKDIKGKIVLIARGTYTMDSKIAYAKSQGAAAVLMYNDNAAEGQIPAYFGEGANFIPSFSLSNADGLALKQKIQAGLTSFTFTDMSAAKTEGDTLADFSSRGPSRVTYDIKPEITAPGVSVLSTVPSYINSPNDTTNYQNAYQRMSGTSMATPFTAGVAALLLQAKPDLQPEDVKAILMNTADPLSKPYSVFEQGAGRIDPFEAIHSSMEIKVKDKTPTFTTGREKQIKEDTGALSFGNIASNGKNINDSREVTFENNGTEAKTFDISVNFQSGLRGAKDAAQNGVEMKTDLSVKVPANSHVTRNVSLSIPAAAEKGIYEGYIVYRNQDDPTETYQVPFGVHYVEEGFQEVKLDRQSMTNDRNNLSNPFFYPYVIAWINLKSHMKYVDVVLADAKTGEDLGFWATFNAMSRDENVPYTIAAFMGAYFPFTNDDNNPISSKAVLAKEGHYKLKFIGYNDEGKAFINAQDLIIDNTMPSKFDIQVDGEKAGNPFVEYKAGQESVGMHASIQDNGVEMMKAAGIKANQSLNTIGYFYNSPWVSGLLHGDENGNLSDEIAMAPSLEVLNLRFDGVDQAKNDYGQKQYFFVKEGTPYVYGQPNAATRLNRVLAKIGDMITVTLTANNVNKLKEAAYNFTTKPVDTNIVNIALNPAAQKLGGQLNVTTTNPNTASIKTDLKVTFDGTTEVSGNIPMVDVTIKIPDMKDNLGISSFNFVTSTFTSVDNKVTKPFTYIAPISIMTKFSGVSSYIHPEAFSRPDGTLISTDFTKIGANVTIVDSQGKTYTGTMNTRGQFYITGLPVTKDELTVITDIPGHFTTSGKFTDAFNIIDGVMYGINKTIGTETVDNAAAGDVNKDNVIDIMDALAIQADWGTNNRSSDINFDGKVDAKDLAFVEKNFLLQNQAVANPPKPLKQYKGKTLADIKSTLGMN